VSVILNNIYSVYICRCLEPGLLSPMNSLVSTLVYVILQPKAGLLQ